MLVLIGFLLQSPLVSAQWTGELENNLFYTDDIGVFSSSRRLALHEDPTQPTVDIPQQGSDMVYEPRVDVWRTFHSRWGRAVLEANGQGFIFATNPGYTHGTYGVSLAQDLAHDTTVRVSFFYGPNMLIGRNRNRLSEQEELIDELVSTHYWSMYVEHHIGSDVTVRLLGRYGARNYNEAFSQRDLTFWTIGPHLEWIITPNIHFLMGYHYERGLADGRKQAIIHDDVSYINHYATSELAIHVSKKGRLILEAEFERNDFTSSIEGDEHVGANEMVYQGAIEYHHHLTHAMVLKIGLQRGGRKFSFEPHWVSNTNVLLGSEFRF
jgi:hypothetical protein